MNLFTSFCKCKNPTWTARWISQLSVPQFLAAVSPIPNPGLCPQGILNQQTLNIQRQTSPAGMLLIFSESVEITRHVSPDSLSAILRDWKAQRGNVQVLAMEAIVADVLRVCICCVLCICNRLKLEGCSSSRFEF